MFAFLQHLFPRRICALPDLLVTFSAIGIFPFNKGFRKINVHIKINGKKDDLDKLKGPVL